MSATIVLNLFRSTKRPHLKEETKIKFPYEERSGTCTLGANELLRAHPMAVKISTGFAIKMAPFPDAC